MLFFMSLSSELQQYCVQKHRLGHDKGVQVLGLSLGLPLGKPCKLSQLFFLKVKIIIEIPHKRLRMY